MKYVKAVKNDSSVVKAVQATEDNISEIYFHLSTDLGCEINFYYKDPDSGSQFVFFKIPHNPMSCDVLGVGDWLVVDADSWCIVSEKDFPKSYRLEKVEEAKGFKCPGYEKNKEGKFKCPGIESFSRLTIGMFSDINAIIKNQNLLKAYIYTNISISVLSLVVLVIHMLMIM